jgi:hydroxyacylglutathione hydrolase
MQLIPIPAFSDNYIWLVHNGQQAIVVDPGDAKPVLQTLEHTGLSLQAILVTHHHADHVGGLAELRDRTNAKVYGPAGEDIPQPLQGMSAKDRVQALELEFTVMDVPGHTAGHIAFYCPDMDGAPLLFCGDTLFSAGCGRLFEGTPAQMLASLDQLAALPANTRVCCTHEYTMSNLRFALAVEPNNPQLLAYSAHCETLRAQDKPTLPSSIGMELAINPFLRSRLPSVKQSVQGLPTGVASEVDVFAALREWKNNFR